jgi:uncharacterized protein (TIGR02145 family)
MAPPLHSKHCDTIQRVREDSSKNQPVYNKYKLKGVLAVLFLSIIVLSSCQKSDITTFVYIKGSGVSDVEGNSYKTVIIGDQEWMAENLKTDFFCNGDSIPASGDSSQVRVYDDDPQNADIYGKLYNFNAVTDTSGLCPCGWEVPSELDFARLIHYLGGYEEAMKKMKASGNLTDGNGLWVKRENFQDLYEGNNLSGFNAIPAGMANTSPFVTNKYADLDTLAAFWSLPITTNRAISYQIYLPEVDKIVHPGELVKEQVFYSIRCIKRI